MLEKIKNTYLMKKMTDESDNNNNIFIQGLRSYLLWNLNNGSDLSK